MKFIKHYFLSLFFEKNSFKKLSDYKLILYISFFICTELVILLINYFRIADLNLLIKESVLNLLLLAFKFLFVIISMNFFLEKQEIFRKTLYGIILINPFRIIEFLLGYNLFIFRLLGAFVILYSLIYVIYFYSNNFEISINKKRYISVPIIISFILAKIVTFLIAGLFNSLIG